MTTRAQLAVWISLRAVLVGLLTLALLLPDLPQFEGKGIGVRLVGYPLATLVVAAAWHLRRRRRDPAASGRPYPWAADALIALPFVLDTLGNALGLFDAVASWDDIMHFISWLLLLSGIGLLLARSTVLARWARMLLVVSLGALLAVLWEAAEYVAFLRTSPELQTAYTDTLADELLGTAGALGAAIVIELAVHRRRTTPRA